MSEESRRILRTHTGSLPRPDALTRLMLDSDQGSIEQGAATVAEAMAEVVRKQLQTGIDVVNDGEFGRPQYATYILDRLGGFEGEVRPPAGRTILDSRQFPDWRP